MGLLNTFWHLNCEKMIFDHFYNNTTNNRGNGAQNQFKIILKTYK